MGMGGWRRGGWEDEWLDEWEGWIDEWGWEVNGRVNGRIDEWGWKVN